MPPVDRLIAQLVQERGHTQTARTQPHAGATPHVGQQEFLRLERLEKEPIYLLKLTVKVGVQSLKLDGSHLGIGDDVLRLLQSAAKGGYSAKINSYLKDAANKLQARQKIIYNRYTVLSEPFRLVHSKALPAALEAIEEMVAEANCLREGIVSTYEQEYAAFLEWVHQVLTAAALETDLIELALRQYAQGYPTLEELQANSLQVLVEGPIKIPSLLETAQQEVESFEKEYSFSKSLAELAKQQVARQAVEVEQQRLKILQRAQETLQQTLVSTLYDARIRSRDEANDKLAQLMESFNLEGANATSRTGQRWETLISRLEVLEGYDSSLEPIIQSARKLQELYLTDAPPLEALQQVLEDFRVMLKKRVQQQDSTGEGLANLTKALALDAGYAQLLEQLDQIAQQPDPEQLRQLQGKLASMENLFKFRAQDLQKRWSQAETAVRQELGLEATAKTKDTVTALDTGDNQKSDRSPYDSTNQPYDPEAGF